MVNSNTVCMKSKWVHTPFQVKRSRTFQGFLDMFTIGSVGRQYRSALSVDTQSICRPSSGRYSVDISAECRSNMSRVSRVSVQYRPICQLILDRHSIHIQPILSQNSADIFLLSVYLSANSVGDLSVKYR